MVNTIVLSRDTRDYALRYVRYGKELLVIRPRLSKQVVKEESDAVADDDRAVTTRQESQPEATQ